MGGVGRFHCRVVEGSEGAVGLSGRSVPDRGQGKCKGPEAEVCLTKRLLAGAQGPRGRVAGRGQGGPGTSTHRPLEGRGGGRQGVTGPADVKQDHTGCWVENTLQ